jgi:elongator complex protein 5
MAHPNLSHRRTHNLLLISKLLNQRDNVSPITIVLDTLEQPAKPLLQEYMRRAEVRSVSHHLQVLTREIRLRKLFQDA